MCNPLKGKLSKQYPEAFPASSGSHSFEKRCKKTRISPRGWRRAGAFTCDTAQKCFFPVGFVSHLLPAPKGIFPCQSQGKVRVVRLLRYQGSWSSLSLPWFPGCLRAPQFPRVAACTFYDSTERWTGPQLPQPARAGRDRGLHLAQSFHLSEEGRMRSRKGKQPGCSNSFRDLQETSRNCLTHLYS